ncbi:unnamed protein product [Symbiodinium sp. CCMP2592]|nr:unnamed protein product [Symbiodinium sp. CCMP2592]
MKEPYSLPLTSGQELANRELLAKPIYASFDGMVNYLRSSTYAYHYGLLVNRGYQEFIKSSADQDTQGKLTALTMVKLDTLIPTFDSSTRVLTICQIDAFVTTSDSPGAEICAFDGVEEKTKTAAIGLPFNYEIDNATAGYPPAFQAAKLGIGRYNNPNFLQMHGETTTEMHRQYLEQLRGIEISRPRKSDAYQDCEEVKLAIAHARTVRTKEAWKRVRRVRRAHRKTWHARRLTQILNGDWDQYRMLQREKTRRRGWWGKMLVDKSSEKLAAETREHLVTKLFNPFQNDWDDLINSQIDAVTETTCFVPFTLLDLRTELHEMRLNSAIGPDGVSVHLLRCLVDDPVLGEDLLGLVNHIVETLELPEKWQVSFLALLAKKDVPETPKDLRPICVSSAFHKLVSRLVCARTMPMLRTGSRISGCGKGRQSADVIGTISRVRDVIHEWRVPALLCKLDISGAFDRIDRLRICEFLRDRLGHRDVPHELKYLLAQLRTYTLAGEAPGGQQIVLDANIGIKQGAPESTELFGMIMDCMLSELTDCQGWKKFGAALPGLDVQLVFYQDDIFLLEGDFVRLCKKINVIEPH